jgi:hypothetical protein
MLKKIQDKIKKTDIFGKRVNLNFDQQGETHRTSIGGIFSILLCIIIIVYGSIKMNVMLTHGADADMSMVQTIDPNSLGQVDINSTGMLFFLQLQ